MLLTYVKRTFSFEDYMPSSGNNIKLQPRWNDRAAPSSGREVETAQVWTQQANRFIRSRSTIKTNLKLIFKRTQNNLHTVIIFLNSAVFSVQFFKIAV